MSAEYRKNLTAAVLCTYISTTLCAQTTSSPESTEPSLEQHEMAFTPAEPLTETRDEDFYPREALRARQESWATLTMAVDPKGLPFEITMIDSMGNPVFETAAITFARKMRFKPARVNETPVETSFILPICFSAVINGRNASQIGTSPFKEDYEKFTSAVEQNDKTTAEAAMASLKPSNLMQDAYLYLGKFYYYRRWGTDDQVLMTLNRATVCNQGNKLFSKETTNAMLKAKLLLQNKMKRFGDALKTYELLDDGMKADPAITRAMAEINSIAADAQSFHVTGETSSTERWFHQLLKRSFSIQIFSGSLTEIKLRCDMKFEKFPHQKNQQYLALKDYGDCLIEVIGTPGTKFILTQSPTLR